MSAQPPRLGSRIDDERLICPVCGTTRRTAETLRVHRWIAHGLQQVAA